MIPGECDNKYKEGRDCRKELSEKRNSSTAIIMEEWKTVAEYCTKYAQWKGNQLRIKCEFIETYFGAIQSNSIFGDMVLDKLCVSEKCPLGDTVLGDMTLHHFVARVYRQWWPSFQNRL